MPSCGSSSVSGSPINEAPRLSHPSPVLDQGHDSLHSSLVLRIKLRQANNALKNIRAHMYIHMGVGLLVAFGMVGLGTMFFYGLFSYLMRLEVFGGALMDQLVNLVLLIFFSLLTFSNLIITLSTTYISKEVEFLMAQPMSRRAIFRLKLTESIFYSSWAFALLSLPLFISYGISREAPWYFYPLVFLLVIPFLAIPAGVGSLVTMVLAAFLPARKTRKLCVVLGIISIGASLVTGKALGIGRMLATADRQDFGQILSMLSLGSTPLLPSAWLGNALRAIGPADPSDINLGEYFYWLAMLMATALFVLEVTRWLVPSLYYRGWCLAKDTSMAPREDKPEGASRAMNMIDRGLGVFPQPVAALLSKDIKTFWRDPGQWTQIVILLGLLAVYIANMRGAARHSEAMSFIVDQWAVVLAFFNLAASCFILSILTTRFVYPMLSLEGRGFWAIGLAPIPRSRILWQKYILCVGLCQIVAQVLTLMSNRVLDLEPAYALLSHVTIGVMSFGLTSLSIGLGAILPNFVEDNPARIANGLGGTTNVILSLLYIAVSVSSLLVPVNILPKVKGGEAIWDTWGVAFIALACLFQIVVIVLPMHIGIKRWMRHEF